MDGKVSFFGRPYSAWIQQLIPFNRANLYVNQGASIVARCVKVGKVNFCLIPRTLGWIPFVHSWATATHTLHSFITATRSERLEKSINQKYGKGATFNSSAFEGHKYPFHCNGTYFVEVLQRCWEQDFWSIFSYRTTRTLFSQVENPWILSDDLQKSPICNIV